MIVSYTCRDEKEFRWEIINDHLYIYRTFKNGEKLNKLPLGLVEFLNQYAISKETIQLGNNVALLHKGVEKDGMGTFLMENGVTSSDAQIASQLAAILCEVGVWTHNCVKKNIEFRSISKKCLDSLFNYYTTHTN